uniref:Putative histone acetyltransferase kat6b n=2 Tax=Ornithodoros turicata TaxID=34597 RepID=A0A2R5LEF8_9ACAR
MPDYKHKDVILDTIDQLRKRKARPDLDRICHMLHRRHGLGKAEVQCELDKLVEAEIVIKVDYKGNTSYRNAAKWVRFNKSVPIEPPTTVATTLKVTRMIGDAVRDMCRAEQDRATAGVLPQEIEAFLQRKDPTFRLTRGALDLALSNEVTAGNLVRLPGGRFAVTEDASPPATDASPPSTDVKSDTVVHEPDGNAVIVESAAKHAFSPSKRIRPLSQRKRIKKTHGPDFVENLDSPTMDTTESYDGDDEPLCFICGLSGAANSSGESEALLICRDCTAKAHPSCMNYTPEVAAAARLSSWQCVDCKMCIFCGGNNDSEEVLVCDACDKGYHMNCHRPKVAQKPLGKWLCKQCCEITERKTKPKTDVDPAAGLPTPCDSPVPEEELKASEAERNAELSLYFSALDQYPDCVPDAKDWSITEVERFLVHVGFPEQANAFKDQEIDGRSLLLMKRSDVLMGLSIKLGPALKIYNHIKRLQTGLPNGHLY